MVRSTPIVRQLTATIPVKSARPSLFSANLRCYILLTAVSFVVYLNSLSCDFVFDDHSAIISNSDLKPNETRIIDLFIHDYWGSPIDLEMSHKSYRPLTVLTFRFNFMIHELSPAGYHLVNVCLHSFAVTLFYRVSKCLIFTTDKTSTYSMIGSIMFAIHPIHTEAVVGVVGRAEELSAVMFLLALLTYHGKKKTIFTICTICSFLCKEQGITVLGVCLVYELTIKPFNEQQSSETKTQVSFLKLLEGSLSSVTFLVVFGLFCVSFRLWIMGGISQFPVFTKFDNPASYSEFPTRHLTYNYLAALNFVLLLFPSNLCCDWTMRSIPLVKEVADLRNAITILVYSIFAVLILCAVKETRTKIIEPQKDAFKRKHRLIPKLPIILSMIVFPYLPASNSLITVGFVIAERTLYIPSIGFCILVSYGIRLINETQRRRNDKLRLIMNPLLLVTVFAFTLKTVTRSVEWKDELSLFESGIKINPQNAKLYNNIGHYYERAGNWTRAMEYFQKAAVISPDDLGSTLNIARTLMNINHLDEAEAILWSLKPRIKSSVIKSKNKRIAPHYLNLWINLGNILSQNQSRLEEAKSIYYELISMRSDYVDAYINLGDVLLKQEQFEDAIATYESALQYNSQKIGELCFNLGVAHSLYLDHLLSSPNPGKKLNHVAAMIEIEKIYEYFSRALDHNTKVSDSLINLAIMAQTHGQLMAEVKPKIMERMKAYNGLDEERIWFNLALLHSDEGQNQTAEYYLRKVIDKRKDYKSALFNLALIMIDSGRLFEAEMYLLQLLKFHPNHMKSLLLLGDIYVEFNETDRAEEVSKEFFERKITNKTEIQGTV